MSHNVTLIHLLYSHQPRLQQHQAEKKRKKEALKPLLPTQHQMANEFSEWLVNIVEHFAGEEPHISLKSWWSPKSEIKRSKYYNN